MNCKGRSRLQPLFWRLGVGLIESNSAPRIPGLKHGFRNLNHWQELPWASFWFSGQNKPPGPRRMAVAMPDGVESLPWLA